MRKEKKGMEVARREVDTTQRDRELNEELKAAKDGDYGATIQLFGIEHAERLEGLDLFDVALQALQPAGLLKKFKPNNAENRLRDGRKLAGLGARGRDPLEMRVRELEGAVEELEHAAKSASNGEN